ncbi:hypothetical protein MKW98_009538 [Papaver atlanticum]|uniref:Glabrous enhancer-binding protein-like DBD domain-containing protein n=1 Tax=Papaver atlanticum TaxID=357466 RepID=A0AAD4XEH0_9MAGN|nr:hypothetical protein MKW98_009538 [Papaver atlanticum]
MDVRKSPRLLKNPSAAAAASSSSTGRVEEREVQEEKSTDHSKQINKLISTYFTPPKLKPNSSTTNTSTTTTVEKSQEVVEEKKSEKPKKKKKDNAGAGAEKDPHRVWTDDDEILLLKDMADYVKRGENPNSAAFYESIQTKISVDVNFEQIRNKIKKARQRYEAKEKEEKKGKVLRFTTPHLQECHELSKPVWGSSGEPKDGGGGVEGSEPVGVENEDDLEIRKSKRDKMRKAAESKKLGKENGEKKDGEKKDGAAEEPEEEDVQVLAVADKQKEVEAENVHVNAVSEKQKEVEGGQTKERNKKKKKKRKTEENVQVHADAEKQKEVEAGETKEKNKKKKKRKAEENVQVHAVVEKQKEVEAGETKERNKKKKKMRKAGAGDAECVSENLIEQLAKAALGLESLLNEETKKAIQSIEPSKVAAFEEKWKKFQVQEAQMLMKRVVLVHELASMISEASVRSPIS